MPVYEYTCTKCQHVTEAIRRIADADAPQACEKCGHAKTKREFSLFNAAPGSGGATDAMPGPCGMPMGGGPGGCCGGGACGY